MYGLDLSIIEWYLNIVWEYWRDHVIISLSKKMLNGNIISELGYLVQVDSFMSFILCIDSICFPKIYTILKDSNFYKFILG